jgi:hypothetical protein
MARKLIPIVCVNYSDKNAFPLAALDVFEAESVDREDDYTYTRRISVQDVTTRRILRNRLHESLEKAEAERLIKILDDHDWDVSFLVDTY